MSVGLTSEIMEMTSGLRAEEAEVMTAVAL